MKVIKRDGTTVDFDRSKIIRAIQKANEAVDPEDPGCWWRISRIWWSIS